MYFFEVKKCIRLRSITGANCRLRETISNTAQPFGNVGFSLVFPRREAEEGIFRNLSLKRGFKEWRPLAFSLC